MELEFDPKLVYAYMLSCLIDDKGVPRFYVRVPFQKLEERTVILTCRDFDDKDLLVSIKLKNVPEEIYSVIAQKGHTDLPEWKKVFSMITPKEVIEKLELPYVDPKEKSAMMAYSSLSKTEKVPKDLALKIYKNILGEGDFYDYL